MNRFIVALVLALLVGAPARAASTYSLSTDASSTTMKLNGRLHMQSLAGVEQLVIDSVKGLFTWTYGIQASTANFTGSGATTYSVTTSSGISVGGTGGVYATFFSATSNFIGNLIGNATTATSATTATTATNISGGGAGQVLYQSGSGATAKLAAGLSTQALVGGASAPAWSTVTGSTLTANITGNAATATAFGATPTHCSGQAATGVDVNGNAVGCFNAGTGDVTQAGNNAFTGANTHSSAGSDTFSGPVTFSSTVYISTMGVANFAAGAYSTSLTTFGQAVTGSTISFVTPANSTITVTLQGDIVVPNTVAWGTEILVDGALYSSTALTSGQTVTNVPANAGFTRHIFVAAAGSHTYALTILVGGSTLTFPANATQNTLGQFSAEYNPVRAQ